MPALLRATGGGWGFPSPLTTTGTALLTSTTNAQWALYSNTSATTSLIEFSDALQMLYGTQGIYSNTATLQMVNYPVYPSRPNDLINSPNIISSARREAMQQRYQAASEWAERRQEADRIKAAAKERARELLLSFLTEEQRKDFETNLAFIVEAASGTKYRITYGRIGNIQVLQQELVRHRLCVHPADNDDLPVEDVMLSQLLHLRADEAELVRRANIHPR